MQPFSVLDKKGFSIIEALVAIAIMSIGLTAFTQWQGTIMKANKSASIRQDVAEVKRSISNSLSCEKTFESLGATRPIACSGAVTLKDKNGNSLTNSGKIDDWTIEASCESLGSPAANGLSIYATKHGKKDPIRNILLDRTHPIASLFTPDLRLCRDYFIATPSGGNLSPKGKCEFHSHAVTRNAAPPRSGSAWRFLPYSCPSERPVMMSIQIGPPCSIPETRWLANLDFSSGPYTSSGVCALQFTYDFLEVYPPSGYTSSNVTSSPAWVNVTAGCGAGVETASCSYVCCDL